MSEETTTKNVAKKTATKKTATKNVAKKTENNNSVLSSQKLRSLFQKNAKEVGIPETPKGQDAQTVREFGKDKLSQLAYGVAIVLSQAFVRGVTEISHDGLRARITSLLGVDVQALWESSDYCSNPIHRGAHALCKRETREVKNGQDTFARGSRFFVLKNGNVGRKQSGFYYPNPAMLSLYVEFAKRDPIPVLKSVLKTIKKTSNLF